MKIPNNYFSINSTRPRFAAGSFFVGGPFSQRRENPGFPGFFTMCYADTVRTQTMVKNTKKEIPAKLLT